MSNVLIHRQAKEAKVSLVVTRADGRVENLGVVAYWHKNPLRRLWWKLTHPKQFRHGFKTRRVE